MRMNLKKFKIKTDCLARKAFLEWNPVRSTLSLHEGSRLTSMSVTWSKTFLDKKSVLNKLAFKVPLVPGYMFRIMSDKIYIREEIL